MKKLTENEQDDPSWPPKDAKPGDRWGAWRLESDGWWRLYAPEQISQMKPAFVLGNNQHEQNL